MSQDSLLNTDSIMFTGIIITDTAFNTFFLLYATWIHTFGNNGFLRALPVASTTIQAPLSLLLGVFLAEGQVDLLEIRPSLQGI
jgi:hypothetical protein